MIEVVEYYQFIISERMEYISDSIGEVFVAVVGVVAMHWLGFNTMAVLLLSMIAWRTRR